MKKAVILSSFSTILDMQEGLPDFFCDPGCVVCCSWCVCHTAGTRAHLLTQVVRRLLRYLHTKRVTGLIGRPKLFPTAAVCLPTTVRTAIIIVCIIWGQQWNIRRRGGGGHSGPSVTAFALSIPPGGGMDCGGSIDPRWVVDQLAFRVLFFRILRSIFFFYVSGAAYLLLYVFP